ncbi:MAG: A/G-specific adenine glycosylase [Flavobacteriaceae bacterium]|jgi:A/G-specific adenine glycosylase
MKDFSLLTANWYRLNKRNLPWRETNNPYYIWLSEIILQQTRIEQGTDYYIKFIAHYPTVEDLASADELDILNDWQGLGYYSRARNLHFSAKYIVNELGGVFPESYSELIQLKGVGSYTAAAVASFAFGESKAVVDGNVYRFLSRLNNLHTPIDSGPGQREFQKLADELIIGADPAIHNQAMMEIGSLICSPQPKCDKCPVTEYCIALKKETIQDLPVKTKKTKVRKRYFHFLIYSSDQKTIIEHRTKKDIWQNMYQFPMIELMNKDDKVPIDVSRRSSYSEPIKHILSHQHIFATFHHIDGFPIKKNDAWMIIDRKDIQDFPLPRVIDRYLEETDNS